MVKCSAPTTAPAPDPATLAWTQDRCAVPEPRGTDGGPADFDPPFTIETPHQAGAPVTPLVVASPHSGRCYPAHFVEASPLDALALRRSEDAFMDRLAAGATDHGAPLIAARFPRAYLDVNREAWELDPRMFEGPLPTWCNTRSVKVASGLGTIARVVADGEPIYRDKLSFAEAEQRVESLYRPYHDALASLLDERRKAFGCAVLIDCHSMPSAGSRSRGSRSGQSGSRRADVVLGDRYGAACAGILSAVAGDVFREAGLSVARNMPYAGGYCTAHYGRPGQGRHALQIEINRALYMDEESLTPLAHFDAVKDLMTEVFARIAALPHDRLCP